MSYSKASALFVAGVLSLAHPAFAENLNINDIFGTWVEEFPKDRTMVSEFTGNSMSVYEVDSLGNPTGARHATVATYRVLGNTILISIEDGKEITALLKNHDQTPDQAFSIRCTPD
jgi:hypothetical protein